MLSAGQSPFVFAGQVATPLLRFGNQVWHSRIRTANPQSVIW
jgi:hypothetical protein